MPKIRIIANADGRTDESTQEKKKTLLSIITLLDSSNIIKTSIIDKSLFNIN